MHRAKNSIPEAGSEAALPGPSPAPSQPPPAPAPVSASPRETAAACTGSGSGCDRGRVAGVRRPAWGERGSSVVWRSGSPPDMLPLHGKEHKLVQVIRRRPWFVPVCRGLSRTCHLLLGACIVVTLQAAWLYFWR